MSDFGTLALAALALKAFSDKPAAKAPEPPPPPKIPDQGGGGGDVVKVAGQVGGLAGAGISALLGAIGGGGGTGGGTALASGVVGTGAATVSAGGGTAAATSSGVGGAFAVGGITAGGVFTLAWAAVFVLQFVAINIVGSLRETWIQYRNSVAKLNMPFLHLHHIERHLVESTLSLLGIRSSWVRADDSALPDSWWKAQHPEEPGNDPRLTTTIREWDPTASRTAILTVPNWRRLYSNPFTGKQATEKWRYLQMAARLVASRYVFDMGRFARGMLSRMPNLSGSGRIFTDSDWGSTPLEVWAYPLLGGGQPDKAYKEFADELRTFGELNTFSIDDVLRAAHLAALVTVASVVATDPGIYSPWNPDLYAQWLYNALGLSAEKDHITLAGQTFVLDTAHYKIPARAMWLDIDELKRGLPCHPFVSGLSISVPSPHVVTAMRAIA